MPNAVNTGFALDMQRKLYRWSVSDKDKIFSELFNPNGWNAEPGEWFLSGTTAEFWAGYRAMATMGTTRSV
jgi:hypothetical protein